MTAASDRSDSTHDVALSAIVRALQDIAAEAMAWMIMSGEECKFNSDTNTITASPFLVDASTPNPPLDTPNGINQASGPFRNVLWCPEG